MKRAGWLLAAVLLASTAQAAEITRTLTAFEPTNPWDANVEIFYERSLRQALVSREKPEASGTRYFDDKELRYSRIDHRMDFRFRFALYRDLELFLTLPVVLSRMQRASLALSGGSPVGVRTGGCAGPGQPTGDSTIVGDGLFRGGGIPSTPDATLPHMDPQNPRVANPRRTILGQAGVTQAAGCYLGESGVPAESLRSGFGDMSLGLAWAPFNNDRDETRPTWLLKLSYTLPTGTTQDPTPVDPAAGNFRPQNDTAGLGMHVLTFETYLSKRLSRAVDPYVGLEYSAFFPGDNSIFRRLNENQENVGPGQRAAIVVGFELTPWENRERRMKFAVDFRLKARATFEGRDYSELADFLGRVTDIETYATFEASLGFYVQITKWFLLRLHLGLAHDTKHFITFANIGEDRNGNTFVDNDPREQNPVYDPLTDQVGRRLSVSETTVFTWGFSVIGMF
jgi:hypothetical protein